MIKNIKIDFFKNKLSILKIKKEIYLYSLILLILLQNTIYANEIKKYSQAEYIMGTIFKIDLYSENEALAKNATSEAFKEIRKYDQILSNYKENSEIEVALKKAYQHPIKISKELYDVLEQSLLVSKLTSGKFDVTIAPLVKLWGFKNKDFKKPSKSQIEKIKKLIGYKKIILDKKNSTLMLTQKDLKIDFGGIGKGYAIGKAVEILKNRGITSGVIDAVSNQFYIGTPPNKENWIVEIKDPRNTEKTIKTLKIKDTSISTSGDYEQFFWEKGIRYSHIIDPNTGYPIKEKISSTLICKDSGLADALSTSILLTTNEETKKILESLSIEYALVISEKTSKLFFEEHKTKNRLKQP